MEDNQESNIPSDQQPPGDTEQVPDYIENATTDPFVRQQIESLYKSQPRPSWKEKFSLFVKLIELFAPKRDKPEDDVTEIAHEPTTVRFQVPQESSTQIAVPQVSHSKNSNDGEEQKPSRKSSLFSFKLPKFADSGEDYGVDTVILAVATVTLFTSIFFLFEDGTLMSDAARENLVKVGDFSVSHNDVRRRVDAGLTWNNVVSPDSVYEGDSIFTGEGSEAAITFADGTVLKVEPKSLVVVRTRGTKLEIGLQYGSLQGKVASGTQSIILSQDGKSQELKSGAGTELRIVKQENTKKTNIQVVSGQIEVKEEDSDAPAQLVQQDEVVEIKAQAPPEVKKAKLALVSPSSGAIVWLPMGKDVGFRWKSDSSMEAVLELSRDSSFASPIFSAQSSSGAYGLSESNRPQGTFYWRVRPLREVDGQPTLPHRLAVYPDVPPLPVLPTDSQIFWLDAEKAQTSKSVFLTWEDRSGSTSYKIEVAKDSNFSDKILQKDTEGTTERLADLGAGQYYWRVMGLHSERANAPWSRTMAFAVRAGSRNPVTPVITNASLKYEIPQTVLSRTPASAVEKGRGVQPELLEPFRWAKVEGATAYEVEIAMDENFTNSIKAEATEASFAPQEVRPGSVFVRVRAKTADGRLSQPSNAGRLDVTLPAPTIAKIVPHRSVFKSQAEADQAKHTFKLSWTPQIFADSYELEWGSSSDFSQSKKFRVKESEREIGVTRAFEYAARVRSLDQNGNPLSPFSPVETAAYKKDVKAPAPVANPLTEKGRTPAQEKQAQLEREKALKAEQEEVARLEAEVAQAEAAEKAKLAAAAAAAVAAKAAPKVKVDKREVGGLSRTIPVPMLREPRPRTSLISLENAPTFVSFKWKGMPGATQYTIQISEDADFTKIVGQAKVSKTAFVFEKPLPEGRVFWRVRAHTKKGFSEWSDISDVNVIYQ